MILLPALLSYNYPSYPSTPRKKRFINYDMRFIILRKRFINYDMRFINYDIIISIILYRQCNRG